MKYDISMIRMPTYEGLASADNCPLLIQSWNVLYTGHAGYL